MKTIFALCASTLATMFATANPSAGGSIAGAPLISTQTGMTWKYRMTHEAGEGFDFPNVPPEAEGKIQSQVTYRLDRTQKIDGKDLLEFEMHRDGAVTNTDLMTVDDSAINCWERIDLRGEITRFNPPQPIVKMPLKTGATWNFDTTLGAANVHQHYAVLGEEEVTVPAGKFRALHIHGQQNSPNEMIVDRWFVKGTGIVKDVTATRNSGGDLVSRVSLELVERPSVGPRPETKSKILSGSVGKDPAGAATNLFSQKVEKIYARWEGHGLREGAAIRVLWIAENVGDVAPANYKIDETKATATAPDSRGVFTLSRPDDGWAPGDYRVEFYVDDALLDTVRLKIAEN